MHGHIIAKILSELSAFLVLLVFLLWLRNRFVSLSVKEVRKIKIPHLIFGASIVTLFKMTLNWLFLSMGVLSTSETVQGQLNGVSIENFILIAISAHFIAPILEELLFRGIFLEWLDEKILFPQSLSIIVTAFVFALAHTYSVTLNLLPYFISGLFLGVVYNYSRSVKYAIVAHILLNISVTSLYLFFSII